MCRRYEPEFLRPLDAGKQHEVLDRVLVGALGVRIADILEPLDFRRNIGQTFEIRRRLTAGF
jgi:hypothetical protein